MFVSLLNRQLVLATRRVERGERVVEFEIDATSWLAKMATVRARFIDATTRAPLAGAMVMVDGAASRMCKLSDAGVLELKACELGWIDFLVTSGAYEFGQNRVRIGPGFNDVGDIAIAQAQFIAGRVIDEHGKGVEIGVDFELIDPTTGEVRRGMSGHGVKGNPDGSFRVGGLSLAQYRLTIRDLTARWGLAAMVVDARHGSVDNVVFRLSRPTSLVVSASGENWRGVIFSIHSDDGSRLMSSRLDRAEPRKIPLAPGRYEIEVRSPELDQPRRIPITIGREPVELALP